MCLVRVSIEDIEAVNLAHTHERFFGYGGKLPSEQYAGQGFSIGSPDGVTHPYPLRGGQTPILQLSGSHPG